MGKIPRKIPPRPIVGTATVVELDYDLDENSRYVVFEFDPPSEHGKFDKVFYGAAFSDDMEPIPMTEEMELFSLKRIARSRGYKLIIPDDFLWED